MQSTTVATLLCAVALGECSDHPTSTAPIAQRLSAGRPAGQWSAEGLASLEWQEIARTFVMQSTVSRNSAAATRVYAYLSVAQYDAVVRAEDAIGGSEPEPEPTPGSGLGSGGRSRLEADRGAVAGSSAAVLTYFDPAEAQLFEEIVQEQANAGLGQPHPDFA